MAAAQGRGDGSEDWAGGRGQPCGPEVASALNAEQPDLPTDGKWGVKKRNLPGVTLRFMD